MGGRTIPRVRWSPYSTPRVCPAVNGNVSEFQRQKNSLGSLSMGSKKKETKTGTRLFLDRFGVSIRGGRSQGRGDWGTLGTEVVVGFHYMVDCSGHLHAIDGSDGHVWACLSTGSWRWGRRASDRVAKWQYALRSSSADPSPQSRPRSARGTSTVACAPL